MAHLHPMTVRTATAARHFSQVARRRTAAALAPSHVRVALQLCFVSDAVMDGRGPRSSRQLPRRLSVLARADDDNDGTLAAWLCVTARGRCAWRPTAGLLCWLG